MRRSWNSDFGHFLKLAVVAFEQAVERKVLIQIRPMNTEGGNFDMIQLPVRASRQTWIFRNQKTNLRAAGHADDDPAINVSGRTSCIR